MGAEEKSLSIYNEGNLFTRLGIAFTKMFAPAQASINNHRINSKRNAVIKNYNAIQKASEDKIELAEKKFEESYVAYLGIIDQLTMDNIYKKAKIDKATEYEKEVLSNYYTIIKLKEDDKNEFNFKKQQYLLELDLNLQKEAKKDKIVKDLEPVFLYEMEQLYKNLLKHYSIKLTEKLDDSRKEAIYQKIFDTLEQYVLKIVPLKNIEDEDVRKLCSDFESFEVGKLDQVDNIEKKKILLAISRKMFVHSLPLIVAERCYVKILKETRSLIVDTTVSRKREAAVSLLMNLIEQYNDKLLKVKIYWNNNDDKKIYTDFVEARKNLELDRDNMDEHDYDVKKQILFIRSDMKYLEKFGDKYFRILNYYRSRLTDLGDMRIVKNSCITLNGEYKAIRKRKVSA